MPTYEYRCTQCRHLFDIHQAVGEAAPSCPQCGALTKKVFASVGLIFKGSGFHTTDYRKAPADNGGEPKGGDKPKESAPTSDSAASTSTTASSNAASSTPSTTPTADKS